MGGWSLVFSVAVLAWWKKGRILALSRDKTWDGDVPPKTNTQGL